MSAIAATRRAGQAASVAGPGEVPGYAGDRPLWPTPRRIAYLGSKVWLDTCAPTAAAFGLQPRVFPAAADPAAAIEAMRGFDPDVAVLIDPPAIAPAIQRELADGRRDFATLGVLVGGLPADQGFDPASCDRLVSFDTTVTGKAIGDATVWRAIPAPVSDALFADVRPLHRAARVLSIGRSSDHRERMLAAAKHHHDLLQLLHGVSGDQLVEVMADYDVGVYFPPWPGPSFGVQVGIHLAAGHLLLSAPLAPAHGLERDIDYLQVDSAGELALVLARLARFPEMYQRVRVRGRMKAEQYRASRLFARLVYDLLADVAAFGRR